ncbi:HEXXH motif domain-containing protein [Burkholderia cenocepacia]|uniref:aKG-HExxH-type peptide beta-hydroxylase n=1 Tax=Burkholderia cenocepacia TaxID=95486 RepID=UPI000F5BEDA6|nr:HEXXH motif-containing putative peptide modification protein [Burkholderia cenocepacia]RQU99795.1 HEXXH motif domain-containing protein [Burkholderia cenocepacia]
MTYPFLPVPSVASSLSMGFKSQLKSAYGDLLEQLSAHAPALFPDSVHAYFAALQPAGFNGFHSFTYHYVIRLAEQNRLPDASRLLMVMARDRYETLPRFAPASRIDRELLREVLDEISGGTSYTEIVLRPLPRDKEQRAERAMTRGVRVLEAVYPELAAEIEILVGSVVFFESTGATNERALSLTGDKLQSMILVNGEIDVSWIFLLDKLIHEAAHTYLYGINLREELVHNSPEAKYASPLRRDDRDMLAIYHATFVIQRLLVAFTRIFERAELLGADRATIQEMLALYRARLDAGFSTIERHGDLSDVARGLINEGQDYAKSLAPC